MQKLEDRAKEILRQDIQISDTVEQRLRETYKILEQEPAVFKKKKRGKQLRTVAAIAVLICLGVPSVAFAAKELDFFDGLFGNTTKKSTPSVTKEIDNQKGGTTSVTLPSHEYVSVDSEEAKQLIGEGAMENPIEKQLGEHTLRIENMVYDKNSVFMYFTLERKGGVTMLLWDEETNVTKGARFAEEELYWFNIETTKGTVYGDNIYVDTEKSTSDKLYCYAYLLSFEPLEEGEFPVLRTTKFPCPPAELPEEYELEEETVTLTTEAPLPTKVLDLGENGYFEYSPISIAFDLSRGTGLTEEEAEDIGNLYYLGFKYKDGTDYVITDTKNNIENNSYVLGTESLSKIAYNRLVNTDEIKEIMINDKAYPVE